jgi:hypothetical protein
MTVPGSSPKRLQPRFSGLLHNSPMKAFLKCLLCSAWLLLTGLSPLQAQDTQDNAETDSTEVEESDEAYRRRMELEDARQRDLGYTLPAPTYAQKQEKLDKLPEESRDNIRDQLVDIIVENGEWEPSDALKEYPYEPTAAARGNPELMQQEQEAWDEQIEKYHKREAAAFGTYLGPAPGPGNPTGEEGGGQEGDGAQGTEPGGGQQGSGAGAQEASQEGAQDAADSASSAGTYEPYQSNRSPSSEEVSTAGVQQSALDFLKGLQGQAPASPSGASANAGATAGATAQSNQPSATESTGQNAEAQASAESARQNADSQSAESAEPEAEAQASADSAEESMDSADQAEQQQSNDRPLEIDLTTPGIIAIKDLDKLEGATASDSPDDSQEQPNPR